MEGIELISFKLISNSGEAKSAFAQALKHSRNEDFEEAERFIKQGEVFLLKAHESHATLIQQESSGKTVEISLLLMHAEDQLMTTELLKMFAQEMILTHKKYSS